MRHPTIIDNYQFTSNTLFFFLFPFCFDVSLQLIDRFLAITASGDDALAKRYLVQADHDLNRAINHFLSDDTDKIESDHISRDTKRLLDIEESSAVSSKRKRTVQTLLNFHKDYENR